MTEEEERSLLGELDAADWSTVRDAAYAADLEALKTLYEARAGNGRATADLSDGARAATYGAIETLLVDIDTVVPGVVDEQTGAINFADEADATSYGVIDEIAGRALASGARVLGVRKADLPGGGHIAAILRYAV
jgi:stalled ribosome rescue protein Dom34